MRVGASEITNTRITARSKVNNPTFAETAKMGHPAGWRRRKARPPAIFPITPTESQKQLLKIVEETGGTQVDIPKGSGLSILKDSGLSRTGFLPFEAFLEEQFRPLFRVYPLIINLPQPVDKPSQLRIDLRSKKDGIHLIYQKTLFPCA